jgi:acetyltransferase-like isoleucine patch superfamily enzyme
MGDRAILEGATQPRAHPIPAPDGARPRSLGRTIRFIWSRRLYMPKYWFLALRYVWLFKIRNRHVRTTGFVFVERGAEIYARRGYGRLTIGRWTWIGAGNHIRCHEGNLTIGEKCVFGATNTINCYLDIEIGSDCILADWIYICDFDHRFDDTTQPIRKQGIVKSPVKIGSDCWLGEKSTVLRGVTIGDGCVVASHALVNRDLPANAIAGGVPARVLKLRGTGQQRS